MLCIGEVIGMSIGDTTNKRFWSLHLQLVLRTLRHIVSHCDQGGVRRTVGRRVPSNGRATRLSNKGFFIRESSHT